MSSATRPKPVFVFEHKMIKEEIETLRHIYLDSMAVPLSIFSLEFAR